MIASVATQSESFTNICSQVSSAQKSYDTCVENISNLDKKVDILQNTRTRQSQLLENISKHLAGVLSLQTSTKTDVTKMASQVEKTVIVEEVNDVFKDWKQQKENTETIILNRKRKELEFSVHILLKKSKRRRLTKSN